MVAIKLARWKCYFGHLQGLHSQLVVWTKFGQNNLVTWLLPVHALEVLQKTSGRGESPRNAEDKAVLSLALSVFVFLRLFWESDQFDQTQINNSPEKKLEKLRIDFESTKGGPKPFRSRNPLKNAVQGSVSWRPVGKVFKVVASKVANETDVLFWKCWIMLAEWGTCWSARKHALLSNEFRWRIRQIEIRMGLELSPTGDQGG